MSQTFSLICEETKQRIWIGQGWRVMTSLYSGDARIMSNLREFLNAHAGKQIKFVCDDLQGDGFSEFVDWSDRPGQNVKHEIDADHYPKVGEAILQGLETTCENVREYSDGGPVQIIIDANTNNRLAIRAVNEGGHNRTTVDLEDLLAWVSKNMPDLYARYDAAAPPQSS